MTEKKPDITETTPEDTMGYDKNHDCLYPNITRKCSITDGTLGRMLKRESGTPDKRSFF